MEIEEILRIVVSVFHMIIWVIGWIHALAPRKVVGLVFKLLGAQVDIEQADTVIRLTRFTGIAAVILIPIIWVWLFFFVISG